MKVYDAASIRNVAVVGHGGCGKTQLVSAMLFVGRRGQPARQGRRRHHRDRLRRRRNRPQAHALLQPRLRRVAEDQNQHHRHAGLRELPDRRPRRASRGRSGRRRRRRGLRRRGADREALGRGRGAQPARASSSSTGSNASARASSARSRRCIATARREIVPIQLPIGEDEGFTGVVDLVRMKALTFAADDSGKMTEGEIPAGAGRRAQQAREQLIEMVAEADEQLMETFFAEGTLTQEQLVAGLRAATMAGKLFPLVCTSGAARHRHPAAARRHRQLRARRRRARLPAPSTPTAHETTVKAVGHGAVLGVRLEDDRRSVRRPHHDAARRHRHAEVRRDRQQRHHAIRPSVSATCWCCRARRRRTCRS